MHRVPEKIFKCPNCSSQFDKQGEFDLHMFQNHNVPIALGTAVSQGVPIRIVNANEAHMKNVMNWLANAKNNSDVSKCNTPNSADL